MVCENRPEILGMAEGALGKERYTRVMAILETDSEVKGKAWWGSSSIWEGRKRTLDVLVSIPSSPIALAAVAVCGAAIIAAERAEGKTFHSPLVDVGYNLGPLIGYDTRTHFLKIRTMVPGAQDRESEFCEDGTVFDAKRKKADPRVTKIGYFIRKLGVVDELPQLFNVVAGQLSIVGPRQLARRDMSIVGTMVDREPYKSYVALHKEGIKPGATGFWAVLERHSDRPDFERWLWEEVVYGLEASFKGDLRIIALTLPVLFKGNSEIK